MEHVVIPTGEIHVPHNWEFADATARAAADITDATLAGRLALQTDDGSYWRLVSIGPVVWTAIKGAPNAHTHPISDITGLPAVLDSLTGRVALTDNPTISLDISLGATFDVTVAGNRTINFTGGTPSLDGKKLLLRVKQDAVGGRVTTLGTGARYGSDITSITWSTSANKMDQVGIVYHHTDGKYDVVGYVRGF